MRHYFYVYPVNHDRCTISEKLWQLKNKQNDEEAFFANFWYCLQHACLVAAREPPTERIIQVFIIAAKITATKYCPRTL